MEALGHIRVSLSQCRKTCHRRKLLAIPAGISGMGLLPLMTQSEFSNLSPKKHSAKRLEPPRGRQVFDELLGLVTEKTNPKSRNLDRLSTIEILRLINSEDAAVARAVRRQLPYIVKAVEMVIAAIKGRGRLFYLGAGTSGRLGVLDAAECPPTFGTDPKMIIGIIAGGYPSLVRSKEGAEDNIRAAIADITKHGIGKRDLVIGISASKRSPYVLEGLREAKKRGAGTVFVCCNPRRIAPREFDLAICPVVGPEVIAGSSRMKAGTAQKMTLNLITTTAMVRLGKVYGNRMVDLQATSEKLKERSKKVLVDICGLPYEDAEKFLNRAGGSVKTALIMSLAGSSKSEADRLLRSADGFVYKALRLAGRSNPLKHK
jgi:N-acetylmuramic acid 6-phosphate etherase